MADEEPPRKRRVRYRGTHPRAFHEKYKELNPDQYQADTRKVIERGQTPAGTHRPIMVGEILKALDPKPGDVGVDATLGFGGHSERLLRRILPGGHLHGLDVDPLEMPRTEERLRGLGYTAEQFTAHRMNFAGIGSVRAMADRGFDFIMADLGVSSMQIDNPARGFTFKAQGPLDLRLNPSHGRPASSLIKSCSEDDLAMMLIENSDEPFAEEIARAIRSRRDSMETTLQLADAVRAALKHKDKEEVGVSLQRTFQAFRIAVNDEFGSLDRLLAMLPRCLAPGGRVAILSFHSGEDRRVKKSFQAYTRAGIFANAVRDPIRPSAEERRANPRSAPAKLRWATMGDRAARDDGDDAHDGDTAESGEGEA